MSEKTLCERKLDLIVFVAECEDIDVLLKLKDLLDEIEGRESSELGDTNPDEILLVD